jgi:hypothetical protein
VWSCGAVIDRFDQRRGASINGRVEAGVCGAQIGRASIVAAAISAAAITSATAIAATGITCTTITGADDAFVRTGHKHEEKREAEFSHRRNLRESLRSEGLIRIKRLFDQPPKQRSVSRALHGSKVVERPTHADATASSSVQSASGTCKHLK